MTWKIKGNTVLKFPFQHSYQYNCSCFYQSDPPHLCRLSSIATVVVWYATQDFQSFITCVLWTSTSISIAIVFERRLCSHEIIYLSVLADLDMTHNLCTFTLVLFQEVPRRRYDTNTAFPNRFIDDPPIGINCTRSSLGTKGEQSVYKSQIHHSLDFLMYRKLSSCFCCCVDYTLFFRLF